MTINQEIDGTKREENIPQGIAEENWYGFA
jgi:hypothetical protein